MASDKQMQQVSCITRDGRTCDRMTGTGTCWGAREVWETMWLCQPLMAYGSWGDDDSGALPKYIARSFAFASLGVLECNVFQIGSRPGFRNSSRQNERMPCMKETWGIRTTQTPTPDAYRSAPCCHLLDWNFPVAGI